MCMHIGVELRRVGGGNTNRLSLFPRSFLLSANARTVARSRTATNGVAETPSGI